MTSCAARAACLVGRRRLLATALGLTSRACTRAIQAAVLPDAMQLSVPRSDVDLVVSDVRMHYEYCRAATQHRATRTWLHATCNAILQRNVHRANRRRAADSSMPFLPIASGSTAPVRSPARLTGRVVSDVGPIARPPAQSRFP